MSIIKKQNPIAFRGEAISKIISSLYYTLSDTKVMDVANEFTKLKGINCIGIIDKKENCIGVISREKIFDVLGKPYGRDVLSYKNVDFLAEKVKTFYADENIISVVDEVRDDLQKYTPTYYLVKSRQERFAGIFSNMDMMIYLSNMIQKDIKLASDLQKSIVKEELIFEDENFSIICHSNMAKEIGGDFYYYNKNGDKIFISLCDVSGKGVSASLITTFLAGENFAFNYGDLGEFIYKLNKDLYSTFQLQKFITAVFLEMDTKTGKINLYDMGHSLIYLIRDKGLLHISARNKNIPLGVVDEIKPIGNNFELKNGDIFVLLTDGLIEQVNVKYEEYGIERSLKCIKNFRNEKLENIRDAILKDLFEFKGSFPQSDDITFIIIKFHPTSSSSITS